MQIGQKLIHLESVDSTNNYAANLIKTVGLSSGTVILADEQFAGKGQRGATWSVESGKNATFSFYLEEANLSVENQFQLSKIVALSLHNLLEKRGIKSEVKWPNDIYVDGRKIAGILIENSISSSKPIRSIIGIGLNVNQTEFGELNATSLKSISGEFSPIEDVVFSFIQSFNQLYNNWIQGELDIDDLYLKHLFQFGKLATYRDSKSKFDGEIIGIAPSGRLQVRRIDGVQEYAMKEIEFL